MRVVSLVPSATETLRAWGVEPVGVTRFCECPEVPAVGGTKDPDLSAVLALVPDLVVMCDEENRREDAEALRDAGVALHVVRIRSVADVVGELAALAAAVGVEPPPPTPLPPAREPSVRAFVPIWRRPWMTMNDDTYGASVLRHLGVRGVFGDAGERYPVVSLAEAVARDPDVVLAPSEPYPFGERHRAELEAVAPVEFVDGRDLFWWGTRTAGALGRLAAGSSAIGRP